MDKEETKEFIETCNKVLLSHVDGQYGIIDTKLDGISTHLAKMNGKVARHEDVIGKALQERARNRQEQSDHIKDCLSFEGRIRKVEDSQLSTKAIKGWIVGSVAIMGGILGVIYTLSQIL